MSLNKYPDVTTVVRNLLRKRFAANDVTEEKKQFIDELFDKCIEYINDVQYHYQDNFTIAIIVAKDGKLFAGASKRHPLDKQNLMRARSIALVRAANELIMHIYVSRPL